MNVVVVYAEEHPIKDAKVTLDAERNEWARPGTTSDTGAVSITPLATEVNRHALQIEADGYATEMMTLDNPPDPVRVQLTPAARYSGTIKNEQGEPIEGVTVRAFAPPPNNQPGMPPTGDSRMIRRAVMKTDAQ